jgi:hypothetical protein
MKDYPAMAATGLGYDGKTKLCARLDISSAKQVNDVNLGDEITVVVKGKVKRMDGPSQYTSSEYLGKGKEKEVERKIPGSVELEITSMEVKTDGEFDGMLED